MSKKQLKQFVVVYYIVVAVIGVTGYTTLFGGTGSASGSDQSGTTVQVGRAPAIDFETVKQIEKTLKEKMNLEVHEGFEKGEVLNYDDFVKDESAWFKGIRNKLGGKKLVLDYSVSYEYETNLENVSVTKTGDAAISVSVPGCILVFKQSNLEIREQKVGWLRSKLSAEEFQEMQKQCDAYYSNKIREEWQNGEQSKANQRLKEKVESLVESILAAAGKKDIQVTVSVN